MASEEKRKKIEDMIVEKIRLGWSKKLGKLGKEFKDVGVIRKIVRLANTEGDGKKRVVYQDRTYLVPIEDIILKGLKGRDVPKYPRLKMKRGRKKKLLSKEEERAKRREYRREWKKKNPKKQKEMQRRYYEKHKEEINAKHMEYLRKNPDKYKKMKEKYKERYRTDPEFRRKCKESNKRWCEKNKVRLRRLQPYTTGLECGFCGFSIKCNLGGRLGKKLVKCPKCRFETKMMNLKKVRIPRKFPVIPTKDSETPKLQNSRYSVSEKLPQSKSDVERRTGK